MARPKKPFSKLLERITGNAKSGKQKWGESGYHREEPLEVNVDTDYLEKIWNKQKDKECTSECSSTLGSSRCPVCGGEMFLDDLYDHTAQHPNKPSPDRKRSGEPYIKGNLQITHQGCNYMKHSHSHKIAKEFIENIKNNNFKPIINKESKMTIGFNERVALLAAQQKDAEAFKFIASLSNNTEDTSDNTGLAKSTLDKHKICDERYAIVQSKSVLYTDDTPVDVIGIREVAKKYYPSMPNQSFGDIFGGAMGTEMKEGFNSVYFKDVDALPIEAKATSDRKIVLDNLYLDVELANKLLDNK